MSDERVRRIYRQLRHERSSVISRALFIATVTSEPVGTAARVPKRSDSDGRKKGEGKNEAGKDEGEA